MSKSSNGNNGGRNSFYDIPKTVFNVDSLARHLKLSGAGFNVLKSLFGINEARHNGTDTLRDSKKIIHYGIENLLIHLEDPNLTHADIISNLYKELSESDKKKFKKLIKK